MDAKRRKLAKVVLVPIIDVEIACGHQLRAWIEPPSEELHFAVGCGECEKALFEALQEFGFNPLLET